MKQKRDIKLSLIITTYNWPEALQKVLDSVRYQSSYPNEVIVADDGSKPETGELIKTIAKDFPVPIVHLWHEDKGFRRTVILNKAFEIAKGDYIVQIDGDIILHPDFIKDHKTEAEISYVVRGSRCMVNERYTPDILSWNTLSFKSFKSISKEHKLNGIRNVFLSFFMTKKYNRLIAVKGCNLAYWKEDALRINGYNNDMVGWGHEDNEFAARLYNSGVKFKKMRFKGVIFHLGHPFASRHNDSLNKSILDKAIREKITYIKNGINII